jgi:predicted AAA+ superfamily ATPase
MDRPRAITYELAGIRAMASVTMNTTTTPVSDEKMLQTLLRIASALERLAPPARKAADLATADAFVWHPAAAELTPVPKVNRVALSLLRGVDRVRDTLAENTERFARGLPANNVLLWGARGMGKSSLVKSVHADTNQRLAGQGSSSGILPLKLIEIHREDIEGLPALMGLLRPDPHRAIVFCDDLSFDGQDTSYKSLKAALDGGVEGRPDNVVFYATSNRRHLLPREMMENERSTAINPGEAVEEKVSLSDRFGLWLGFHKCSQDEYLSMIDGYVGHFGLTIDPELQRREALEWATTRGSRSGRTAWQYIQDLAGRLGQRLES